MEYLNSLETYYIVGGEGDVSGYDINIIGGGEGIYRDSTDNSQREEQKN